MTISSTTRIAGPFSGTGSQAAFAFAFKVFQPSDLLVTLTDASGNFTTQTLTSQYSVTLNANQASSPGGTVTMVTPPPSGYTLVIGSQVPALQTTDLTNAGNFYPAAVNNALDYLTILVQQTLTGGANGSTIRVPEIAGVPQLPSAAQRANSYLLFDALGNPTTSAIGSIAGQLAFYVPPGVTQTLNVPGTYSTVAVALAAIASWLIHGTVNIQIAAGTYAYTSSITIAHPSGKNIHILGNITTPSNCLLNFSASDGFYIPPGYQIGEINGIRIAKTGAKANLGFGTDGGAYLKLGPNVEVDNFYYGLPARNFGYINAGGTATNFVKITNAGDAGVWAFNNSYVNCEFADISLTSDSANNLGGGIVAEFTSMVQANMAKTHGNFLCGLSALTNSTIRAWSVQSYGNSQGVITGSGGKIELFNQAGAPTITQIINNTNYGHYCADSYGAVFGLSSALTTGNGTGVEAIGWKFGSDGSAKAQSGSITIDATGPATVTSGPAYLDMNVTTAQFAVIRALLNGAEVARQQYDVANAVYTWAIGANTKVRINASGLAGLGVITSDGGASDGYVDILGATNHFAITRWLTNGVERARAQYDDANAVWTLGVNGNTVLRVATTGKTAIGKSAPATTATTGHLQIPAQAGAPTGVVTDTQAGFVPIVFDTTNNKLWVFNGTWKGVVLA